MTMRCLSILISHNLRTFDGYGKKYVLDLELGFPRGRPRGTILSASSFLGGTLRKYQQGYEAEKRRKSVKNV